MNTADFNQELLSFIQSSPTPFHAVETMKKRLVAENFQQLRTEDTWTLEKGKRYFVTRNDSSIIAFVYGKKSMQENGLRMVGAHTDSPCLRVKPQPDLLRHGVFQLGVEVYGGVLLAPWFDRDLSLAGRVSLTNKNGELKNCLIDFKKAIATVPSLAIHLDRTANENRSINSQKDIPPVLAFVNTETDMTGKKKQITFNSVLLNHLHQHHSDLQADKILDYELSFYDVQPPAIIGLHDQLIASARLDNLASCCIGLQSLVEADNDHTSMLICTDHEEIGSQSASGAAGPMLRDLLIRMMPEPENYQRAMEKSLLISADNAHAIHPNFSDKHDQNHGPLINAGPVIKTNTNQRYATNSNTSGVFKFIAGIDNISVQSFVTRTDLGCGSTIGPITASKVGVATIDVGIPTYGMHSIREVAGTEDGFALYRILSRFLAVDQLYS
ncbi:MAG: M18 family aminopeptidase [Cellvibrionaceae bacterium]